MSKIMNVFYGADCLPYKDKERQVHYPIVGQGFQGASNTTEIKFYIDQIGAIDDSWVAIAKLPNGKVGSKLLSDSGEDENGRYVSLQLSSFYTQYVGNLFISLQGYKGGEVEYDSETELYVINGTPTIEATGPIKLAINYSTQYNGSDEDEQITVQEALAIVSTKLDKNSPKYFKVINELSDLSSDEYADFLNVGDIFYCKEETGFYRITALTPTPTYERISARFDDLTAYGDFAVQGDTELQYLDVYSGAEFYDDVNFDKSINVANTIFITNFDYIEDGGGNTLKDELDGKVNKTSGLNQVHVTNGSGQETTIGYSEQTGGNIVLRKANGQVYVPTEPLLPNDAASRQFVLDKVAEYGENEIQVVSELPQTGVEGIIYLLPIDPQDLSKGYQRYIYENNTWLSLGTTEVDLSDYQKKLVAGTNIGINQTTNVIKVSDNPTFNTITASELRADNTLYQLYLESLSNDKVGMAYTNNDLSSDICIYQGVPEIINASSNYQLSVRVGTQDIDIEVKDFNNDTIESISLLEELDKKANVDGNYPTLTSGLADNLTPYSEDSGAEQEKPFISNGTGTNNNQEIVTVGDYGLLRSKNGNTLIVNQLAQLNNATETINGITFTKNNDGSWTLSGTASADTTKEIASFQAIQGHKALLFGDFGGSSSTYSINIGGAVFSNGVGKTYTMGMTGTSYINVVVKNGTTVNNVKVYPRVVDLAQMFNGDIPQDLLDNPDHFSWYYNGDLSYNTGTLVNANGVKLVSTGRNIWDEETILVRGHLESKNYTRVVPNTFIKIKAPISINSLFGNGWKWFDENKNQVGSTIYYFVNAPIQVPSNACYFKFALISTYGTTYNYDITFSPYYTPEQGGEGYDQYYPYEAPYEVDTGSEVLRSAGNDKDVKLPSGEITRNVVQFSYNGSKATVDGVEYNVSDKSVNSVTGGYVFVFNIAGIGDKYSASQTNKHIDNYGLDSLNPFNGINRFYAFNSSGYLQVAISISGYSTVSEYDTLFSSKPFVANIKQITPTTEQGTSFSENLPINDYGMMYWDNTNGIPQGATIFFPINYKGFVDDMYSRVDGDSSDYALNSELNAKFEAYLKSLSGYDSTTTQVLKNVEGTLTWVTEE